jgi:uncharacterized protein with HEPN domain
MSKAGRLRVPDYLRHILEAIRRIQHYVADMDEARFLADEKTPGRCHPEFRDHR